MRIFGLNLTKFLLLVPFFLSCNSAPSDLDERKENDVPKTEIKPEIKQEIQQQKPEIKQDVNKETMPLRQYAVQIGAFISESNAGNFAQNAENTMNSDVNYVLADGMYKVRIGSFSSLTDAFRVLAQTQAFGYKDSFITEINK